MAHDYLAFVASAYGLSALALGALGAWVLLDARGVRARLRRLDATGMARRRGKASDGRP